LDQIHSLDVNYAALLRHKANPIRGTPPGCINARDGATGLATSPGNETA
jgi:hypothetical protein